jgi:hypothetical protein
MEDLNKLFDKNISAEIWFLYNPKFMELMDRPEGIPDLKEKFGID